MHQIDRPIVGHLPSQRNTATAIGRVVIIVLNKSVVVDSLTGRRTVQTSCAIRNGSGGSGLARLDRARDQQWVAGWQLTGDAHIAVERHLVCARNIVDITTLAVGIKHSANGQLILNDWDVNECITSNALFTALGKGVAGVEAGTKCARIGLIGNVADRTTHRTSAEERALRTCQNFDALKVNSVKVKVTSNEGCWRIVNVQSDRWLRTSGTGNLQAWRIRRKAADKDRRCTWTARSSAHVRQIFDQFFEFGYVEVAQRVTAQSSNRERNFVYRLFATCCGHNDVGDTAVLIFCCLLRKCRSDTDTNASRCNNKRSRRNFQITFQFHSPQPSPDVARAFKLHLVD